MPLIVYPSGRAEWRGRILRCALGRSGVSAAKREGDGATPIGIFPFRSVYFRADRMAAPSTSLPLRAIGQDAGWCDDPARPEYNQAVMLPFSGGHEILWRSDHLYDLIVVLGYNDNPVIPGKGSAIFLHLATPDFGPTEGCVALERAALLDVVSQCDADETIHIREIAP